jgi:acetyltransferase
MLWTGGCNDDPSLTPAVLAAEGVAVYRNTLSCMKAVRASVDYSAFLRGARRSTAPVRPAGVDPDTVGRLLDGLRGNMTERASKAVLAACGLPVTVERLARDADEAVDAATAIGGAVAMKIESADIPHKTEAGAIRLGVEGDAAVRTAFAGVMVAAERFRPDARIDGVLVQEMAPPGLEMMLGIVTDPVFGPVVVAGLCGIHVEVLNDIAVRVAPVSEAEADAMLRELRGYRLLEGVRGAAPCDLEALRDALVRLSWLAHDQQASLVELDINPLVLYERGAGAKVVDALIVGRKGDGNTGA